ncbi:hypothetical protein [Macromonas nakdongensis]|uniref:hypothetical protein n=1 Tax=Macromonas nakdongensis TaxID=1843082 RepID=UPI000C33176D|nr:hypothetical protein [Macromonas nakdongensis]
MMSCREYVFALTSGRLEEAGPTERFWAAQHRLMCRRCRAFTHNDAALDRILQGYQAHVQRQTEDGTSGPAPEV